VRQSVRYIGNCGSYGGVMVLVTTTYSLFNLSRLLSGNPMKTTTIYRYEKNGRFYDFEGNMPSSVELTAINEKLVAIGKLP
jgi:hypothetical protein